MPVCTNCVSSRNHLLIIYCFRLIPKQVLGKQIVEGKFQRCHFETSNIQFRDKVIDSRSKNKIKIKWKLSDWNNTIFVDWRYNELGIFCDLTKYIFTFTLICRLLCCHYLARFYLSVCVCVPIYIYVGGCMSTSLKSAVYHMLIHNAIYKSMFS